MIIVMIIFQVNNVKKSLGNSWCPDCVTAQPVVESTIEKEVKQPTNYLYVGVGDRTFWKDQGNIFRKSGLTKLKSVPTFFKWTAPGNRLEEEKCTNPDLIQMIIEQELYCNFPLDMLICQMFQKK